MSAPPLGSHAIERSEGDYKPREGYVAGRWHDPDTGVEHVRLLRWRRDAGRILVDFVTLEAEALDPALTTEVHRHGAGCLATEICGYLGQEFARGRRVSAGWDDDRFALLELAVAMAKLAAAP